MKFLLLLLILSGCATNTTPDNCQIIVDDVIKNTKYKEYNCHQKPVYLNCLMTYRMKNGGYRCILQRYDR